jgi:hypothetical protein
MVIYGYEKYPEQVDPWCVSGFTPEGSGGLRLRIPGMCLTPYMGNTLS